ncbi:hypothetical protein [Amycolatopsis sp. GM8]|uniref:hypothetical protein n=1 Tax=Amycolatopsis sp. GM8 TaxID=2896530 RepID=UPI001F3DF539|nr:hypothetical protein [Amycolatopsis sp. GM8]
MDIDLRAPVLPLWPVCLPLAGYPLFWATGFGYLAFALCAVPMCVLLAVRGDVRMPAGFALWLLFVAWVVLSAIELDSGLRLVGFVFRLSGYLAAAVIFLYVYNLPRSEMDHVLAALCAFFAVAVCGGWLGLLFPDGKLNTPLSALMPSTLTSNSYVDALVRPAFAEVHQPWGAPAPFRRPSAPFTYTNGWGCSVALLVPCVLAYAATHRGRARAIALVLLAAAVPPAVATLNRGMFIGLGVGLGYAALRLAMRARWRTLARLVAVAGVAVAFVLASGTAARLTERVTYSETNENRSALYQEAFRGAVTSPVFGHGAPRPSAVLDISVGTQGQIWNVLFCYGFPGLVFFASWFVWVAWVSRRWRHLSDLWLHTCLVVGAVSIWYYGYDGPQLQVVLTVAAIVLARVRPR